MHAMSCVHAWVYGCALTFRVQSDVLAFILHGRANIYLGDLQAIHVMNGRSLSWQKLAAKLN